MTSLTFTMAFDTSVAPLNAQYHPMALRLTRNGKTYRPLWMVQIAPSGLTRCTDLEIRSDGDLYIPTHMLATPAPRWEVTPIQIGHYLAREMALRELISSEEFSQLMANHGTLTVTAPTADYPDDTLLLKAMLAGCTLTPVVNRLKQMQDPSAPYITGYVITLRTRSDRLETEINDGMPLLTPEVREQLQEELRRINHFAS